MSKRGRGMGKGGKDREIGKNEEFAIGEGRSFCDDLVFAIRDDTMALARVKVSGVVGLAKKVYRDKANGRTRDVEGVLESEAAIRSVEGNGPYTQSVDRVTAEPFYGVSFNGPKGAKIGEEGRYVASGPSINNEG